MKIRLLILCVFLLIPVFSKASEYQWTIQTGGPRQDETAGLFVDASGNIYIAGSFSSNVNFMRFWSGSDIRTSKGLTDIFITKIDNAGNYIWTRTMGGLKKDKGAAVCADLNGNVYAAGYASSNVNFAADWGGVDSKTCFSKYDAFVTRINADGSYGWTKRMGAQTRTRRTISKRILTDWFI